MLIRILGRTDSEIRAEAGRNGLRLPPEEWRDLAGRLGRDPTLTEAFLFDVAQSEHCSYKSSRPLLKQYLPPLASHVILGPGEDSGIVDLGIWDGTRWALVVAHESHNHPSQVLPVEGAATGIGGIVRDVYCMGADVIGVLDGLRFGDPEGPNANRVRAIARGVIQGISEYGNALGVPNLGGDVAFHEGFDDNCLVNVVALGVMPLARLIRSRVPEAARREPYVIILVGKPTDDTGLGGASFASQILDEAEVGGNRGAVQIHDPFLKRVLAEATREVLEWRERTGCEIGCKDLGAGGLGGASSELVLAGGFGADIDLSLVPRGIPDLGPHQVLCAETQERFVWAVPEARAPEFCAFFNEAYELGRIYPGAAAKVIGRVIPETIYRCRWEGEVVVDVAGEILENPPALSRPRAARPAPSLAADPPAPPEGAWGAWAVERLSGWDAASRAPVFRFYDQEVRGEALLRPGDADAGVCRPVHGTDLAIAVSLDGNPDYGLLDPYWAAALAVCEAARNVAAVGARPLCLTDCLNFGSPEDPVCLGDFEEALRGMADACRAIGSPERPDEPLPIVSGNVSFYNQSATGRAIPPSPIICCYGMLMDYGHALTHRLKSAGSLLLLTGRRTKAWGRAGKGTSGGRVPRPDLAMEAAEIRAIPSLADQDLLRSCHDVSDGGLLRALWEMLIREEEPVGLGAVVDLRSLRESGIGAAGTVVSGISGSGASAAGASAKEGSAAGASAAETSGAGLQPHELLLSESPGFVLEVAPENEEAVRSSLRQNGIPCTVLGRVVPEPTLSIVDGPARLLDLDLGPALQAWRARLEGITRQSAAPGSEGGR